jgi:hypothetical protein
MLAKTQQGTSKNTQLITAGEFDRMREKVQSSAQVSSWRNRIRLEMEKKHYEQR